MGNIEKETIEDKTPESGLMMSEIAPVLYRERDVLEEAEGSGNRSRKLGAAGLAIITVLSCVGANKAEAGGINFGQILNQSAQQGADHFIRESFDAIREQRQAKQRMEEEAIRQRQNMQTEEIRRMQNMQSDQVRMIQDQQRQIGQEELNALRDFKDGKISKERLTDLKREYKEQRENLTRGR